MSLRGDTARLEYVIKLIDDIHVIIERHGDTASALKDTEGYHALMMCLTQIGETLNSIKDEEMRKALPVSLAYGFRNVIAHNYLGVNSQVVITTIDDDLPGLKSLYWIYYRNQPDNRPPEVDTTVRYLSCNHKFVYSERSRGSAKPLWR